MKTLKFWEQNGCSCLIYVDTDNIQGRYNSIYDIGDVTMYSYCAGVITKHDDIDFVTSKTFRIRLKQYELLE